MVKLYAMIALVGVLGIAGYGAKYYYDTTQATISTLRENNSRLEVAVQTQVDSINMMLEEAGFGDIKVTVHTKPPVSYISDIDITAILTQNELRAIAGFEPLEEEEQEQENE